MSYMEIRNLKKVYNPYGVHPKVALNGLDFKVEKGDFICIMGPLVQERQHWLISCQRLMKQLLDKFFLIKDLLLLWKRNKSKKKKKLVYLSKL